MSERNIFGLFHSLKVTEYWWQQFSVRTFFIRTLNAEINITQILKRYKNTRKIIESITGSYNNPNENIWRLEILTEEQLRNISDSKWPKQTKNIYLQSEDYSLLQKSVAIYLQRYVNKGDYKPANSCVTSSACLAGYPWVIYSGL